MWQILDTQATGASLDLRGRAQLWDWRNLGRLRVDVGGTVARAEAGEIHVAENGRVFWSDRWRDAWNNKLVGITLAVPRLRTSELGVQWYQLVDSSDRWRISGGYASFYELLLNRPDSEYYTRKGLTAYWTGHFAERLLVGVEYRRDRYGSLSPVEKPVSFGDNDLGFPNPPIDDGRMASFLFRAEWSSYRPSERSVGAFVRHTETSLIRHDAGEWRTGIHSLATLEVADPSRGGDKRFDFTRLISDTTLTLATARESGARLRFRLAGGGNLPRQKEEALGGWSALRGFEFKEFRGDWSVLSTLEARAQAVAPFVDLGAVHEPNGWTSLKAGIGLKFYLGKAQVVTALRTDGGHGSEVQVRAFLGRGF